jgi:anti-sigma B factor antagonist
VSSIQIDTTFGANVLVIMPLEARLDARVAPAFGVALIEHIERGHRNVMVNMEEVEFIDSSGLGALAAALERIGLEGQLTVCSLNAYVRSTFEATRLPRVIPIAD